METEIAEAQLQTLINEITLKSSLIQGHIQKEHRGNISAFGRSFASDAPPHRATVMRWMSNSKNVLPKSARRLFELAETLDLDPFMLLDIQESTFEGLCGLSSWVTQWGKYHKSLTFLSDLVGLSVSEWPAPHMTEHYDSHWHHWDLEHASHLKNNYFFSLGLKPEVYYDLEEEQTVECLRDKQVWYIAIRDATTRGDDVIGHGVWRPFGIFFIEDKTLNLLNIGTGQWLKKPLESDAFCVEFYCGPGSGVFRVASLHSFEVIHNPSECEPLARLRYTFPE